MTVHNTCEHCQHQSLTEHVKARLISCDTTQNANAAKPLFFSPESHLENTFKAFLGPKKDTLEHYIREIKPVKTMPTVYRCDGGK